MTDWCTLSPEEALQHANGTAQGLTDTEAALRLERFGPNAMPVQRAYSALRCFLSQFNNVLIYILLGSAAVTAFMQHWTDTGVILAVTLINAAIGFFQEYRAEQALAAIRNLLPLRASVLRDGHARLIDAVELVPGDVVLIAAGDKVPADLRLLSAHALRAQESILTGESMDVEKSAEAAAGGCMAYSGTLIVGGQGKGVVVATGADTEIGRISASVGGAKPPVTPLAHKLSRLSRWLAALIIGAACGVFLYGVYGRGLPAGDMFMVMIGIAVSSVPEGLPAAISITLALGVRAMARRHAIVRHMPAIETLGRVTVICTDKTGTLTRNELAVSHIATAEHAFTVTGVGYTPEGKCLLEDKEIALSDYSAASQMLQGATLNNDATLRLKAGVWELNGDPTEGALLTLALKAGQDRGTQPARQDVIPFSAEARYMATLHHYADKAISYVKGAPEQLLSMCDREMRNDGETDPLRLDYWQALVAEMAERGERVLAIACKPLPIHHAKLQPKDIAGSLILLGLFGITDKPRPEAAAAIAECYRAGIEVKMITGDHVLTAAAIGDELGIARCERVMTGSDMDKLSDAALAKLAREIHIFARMHPSQKLRLVQALQSQGEIVAMTGDGVNDAPALARADIGIAMGRQGTEVAREASRLVLADDNFASIVHAIEEGRNIYERLKRTIVFMLATDGSEGLCLVLAVLAGLTLPITPLQILWVNMVTAVTLSLAFAFAPNDARLMRLRPLAPDTSFIDTSLAGRMVLHVVLMAFGTLGIFYYVQARGTPLEEARSMAVDALVFFQVYYLWAFFPRPDRHGWAWLLPLAIPSLGVIGLQWLFTQWQVLQQLFDTRSLAPAQWAFIALATAPIWLWLTVEQRIYSRK